MSLGPVIRLLTKMSLKDGLWVVLFYFITVIVFGNINILENYTQLGLFIIISLTFSFIDEKVSLKMGRWSYAKNMPTIFGVGITPLLEVAVTGVLAFAIVFLI
ncbi:hypothetical protein HOG29_02625 [bacterium]|nr:hypothetical protein [bacterium]